MDCFNPKALHKLPEIKIAVRESISDVLKTSGFGSEISKRDVTLPFLRGN